MIDGAKLAEVLSVERSWEIGVALKAMGLEYYGEDVKKYSMLLRELEIEERFGHLFPQDDEEEALVNGH